MSFEYEADFAGVQVTGPDSQFVVYMEMKTCACKKWDLTGIPCQHACCCITENNEEPEKYVDECYSVETFNKVYSHVINPTNGIGL